MANRKHAKTRKHGNRVERRTSRKGGGRDPGGQWSVVWFSRQMGKKFIGLHALPGGSSAGSSDRPTRDLRKRKSDRRRNDAARVRSARGYPAWSWPSACVRGGHRYCLH